MAVTNRAMENTLSQRGVLCACVLVLAVFGGLWGMLTCVLAQESVASDRKVVMIEGVEYAFRFCPAGEFIMGSPTGESDRDSDEMPRRVKLTKGFWMLETEVTQEMWKSVMGSNPSTFEGKKLPVENVSWDDCKAFFQKLNRLAVPVKGMKFSLPTEAQWEYACRAGTTGAYGGTVVLNEMVWYADNSEGKTHEVGMKKPNAWGLYDMHGNVLEWCSDWYGNYSDGIAADPIGPSTGSYHVNRGGSWHSDARLCRSADRNGDATLLRYYDLGVRISLVSE